MKNKAIQKVRARVKKAKIRLDAIRCINKWKPYFKLSDWNIRVEADSSEDYTSYSSVSTNTAERAIHITVNGRDWDTLGSHGKTPTLEEVMIHELVHARMTTVEVGWKNVIYDYDKHLQKTEKAPKRPDAVDIVSTALTEPMEQFVNDIVDVILRRKKRRY